MSDKPKIAFYWCAACGGCEEAVVDLEEKILDVVTAVDIVLWPVAMDFKRKDIERLPDGSLFAALINGAVRTTEQEEMVHLLRRKAKVVVAFGACAQLGGIPGLANLWDRESIFKQVYVEAPSAVNPEQMMPARVHKVDGHTLTLPGFFNTVRTLDQVIDVDYSIPGCAPKPAVILSAVQTLLSGTLPPKGAVLAPDHALCEDCPRKDTRPEKLLVAEFKRPHQVLIEEDKCLLAQGLLCMGPATRSGCDAACPTGNMPCTGCSGPTSRVRDHGGKALSSIASLVDSNEEQVIERILSGIPDPVGTVYRYGLPASLLHRKRTATRHAV